MVLPHKCFLDEWIASWVSVCVIRRPHSLSGAPGAKKDSFPFAMESEFSLEQCQQLPSRPWQVGPSRSFAQLSESLEKRFIQLLDVGFYFYTMVAIFDRWQRWGIEQSSSKESYIKSSNPLTWWVPSFLLPLGRRAFTFVFYFLSFFCLHFPLIFFNLGIANTRYFWFQMNNKVIQQFL